MNFYEFLNSEAGIILSVLGMLLLIILVPVMYGFISSEINNHPHTTPPPPPSCPHYIKHSNGDIECFSSK